MNARQPASRGGDLASWSLLGAMLVLLLALNGRDPFGIAWGRALLPGLGILLLLAIALAGRFSDRPRLEAAGTAFLKLTLGTILSVMLSYGLAARGGPLWDAQLAAWDRALGFRWEAIREVADSSGAFVRILGLAYHGLIPQMIVLVVALSYRARFRVLRVTVAAGILSGFATVLVSGFLPAAGNLFDPDRYRHLGPPVALLQADLIAGLRDGSMRMLDLGAMQGIITFPSYHATLAAIFVWSFRAVPRLALPGGLWAALTILATPLGGGHYGVDVIAGLLLALASVPAAERLVRLGERPASTPREVAALAFRTVAADTLRIAPTRRLPATAEAARPARARRAPDARYG